MKFGWDEWGVVAAGTPLDAGLLRTLIIVRQPCFFVGLWALKHVVPFFDFATPPMAYPSPEYRRSSIDQIGPSADIHRMKIDLRQKRRTLRADGAGAGLWNL